MVLRNHVEWAVHCCSVLAGLPAGKYLATKDLAEFHGVPKEYLSKALQELSRAGLLDMALGPSGGYRLAKPPSAISFLDIVDAVDDGPRFRCTEIRRNNPCRPHGMKDKGMCSVARVMHDADDAWRAHLASVSLADLRKTLDRAIPTDIAERSQEWIAERL